MDLITSPISVVEMVEVVIWLGARHSAEAVGKRYGSMQECFALTEGFAGFLNDTLSGESTLYIHTIGHSERPKGAKNLEFDGLLSMQSKPRVLWFQILRPLGGLGMTCLGGGAHSLHGGAKHSAEAVGKRYGSMMECFALTGCFAGFHNDMHCDLTSSLFPSRSRTPL